MHVPAPDFTAEVISESTEANDRGIKFEDYVAHGVQEYWITDPLKESVEQYQLVQNRYELVMKSDSSVVKSLVLPDFQLPMRAIFDDQINRSTRSGILKRNDAGQTGNIPESDCGKMTAAKPKEHTFVIDERIRKMIAGAVAEVDPAQIAALRKMTPPQRFAQMLSMVSFTETAAADRLRLREQTLSERQALHIVRSGGMMQWLIKHRKQTRDARNDRRTA